MAEPLELAVDVAVFGGGIAGLWLAARLGKAGYAVVLFEAGALGGGQSMAAQGIIHGGLKYALDQRFAAAATAIGDMPSLWRRCLAGDAAPDLRGVPVLAPRHLFWVPRSWLGRATGLVAAKLTRSEAERLAEDAWPPALAGQPGIGAVYALDEPVIDVPATIAALAEACGDILIESGAAGDLATETEGERLRAVRLFRPATPPLRVSAKLWVMTAGAGNEALAPLLAAATVAAQRRPLHMVLLKGAPSALFAHCFDGGDKPRLTVTSHRARDGALVWYLGGRLAEDGVALSGPEVIGHARRELAALLPALRLEQAAFAAFRIDRAEGRQAGGRRPDQPVLHWAGADRIVAWPTKLAFAPRLAEALMDAIGRAGLVPSGRPIQRPAGWPRPVLALSPWERVEWS